MEKRKRSGCQPRCSYRSTIIHHEKINTQVFLRQSSYFHFDLFVDRKRLKKEAADGAMSKTPKFSIGFLSGSQLALIASLLDDATITHLILMSKNTFIPLTGEFTSQSLALHTRYNVYYIYVCSLMQRYRRNLLRLRHWWMVISYHGSQQFKI